MLLAAVCNRLLNSPQFLQIYKEYVEQVDNHLRSTRSTTLANHFKEQHTSFFFPNVNDGDPVIGLQGYDEPIELYMEAVMVYFYRPDWLRTNHPALYDFVDQTMNMLRWM